MRLNSTAVRVRNDGNLVLPKGPCDIHEGRSGVHGAGEPVALACYNMIIPYLLPSFRAPKKALHELVKTPLVYTSVLRFAIHARLRSSGQSHLCAGLLSHPCAAQRDCRHWRLPQPSFPRRSKPSVDGEDSLQARSVGTRSEPRAAVRSYWHLRSRYSNEASARNSGGCLDLGL